MCDFIASLHGVLGLYRALLLYSVRYLHADAVHNDLWCIRARMGGMRHCWGAISWLSSANLKPPALSSKQSIVLSSLTTRSINAQNAACRAQLHVGLQLLHMHIAQTAVHDSTCRLGRACLARHACDALLPFNILLPYTIPGLAHIINIIYSMYKM
jgi:hypothetical protein